MKVLAALSIAMLLVVAGCSSTTFYWYHPDRTLDEAKADYTECLDQARQKADEMITDQHYDRLLPPDGSSVSKISPRDRPAAAPHDAQDAWREQYEQSVVTNCMREKGYLRIGTDKVPRGVHTKKFSRGAVAGR
jgi:hypothetical protein